MITLRPERWRDLDVGELEAGLLRENLDVIGTTVTDERPTRHTLHLHFRGSPTRAVKVDCIAVPGAQGDGFQAPSGPLPFTVEISQSRGQSPEMEFLADRSSLLCQRLLGGLLEHGESGREFRSWNRFASYLSEKIYSWPEHLKRRIRHHFGTPDHLFESNIEIKGESIDLALFPPRVSHIPEHAIWIFRLADRGDREARRRLKKLLRRSRHLRRAVLVAGDGLRCYERRLYPDGPRADRMPFADLALTPDATFGLVRGDQGPGAFRGAPFGLRCFIEAMGSELVDHSFLILDAETEGRPLGEVLREAGIPARAVDGDTAVLDFPGLMRLRRLPTLGASDLVFADIPPDVPPPRVNRGEPVDPEALRRRLGSRFLYAGRDDVLLTIHVRERRDALRLCAYTLRRYLRYYRPDQAKAHSPPVHVVEQLHEVLEGRYLILPEAGPQEEGSSIALDLYEGQHLWRAGSRVSSERAARLLYQPAGEVWSVRETG